jgi:hypothetical protein
MRLRWESMVRVGGLTLVALALALRLAVPSGFMVAGDGAGAATLIICTGHGPAQWPGRAPRPDDRSKPADHPCAFAGHATPTPPTPLALIAPSPLAAYAAPPSARLADQRPGLGLAAPPPPAVGPPAASI